MSKNTGPQDEVYWYTLRKPEWKKLEQDLSAEVVIVGGGVAGLSCADELVKHGKKVVVVESTFCGGGASGKSSGFITPDSELELSNFVTRFKDAEAKKIWEFGRGGVALIQNTIAKYGIECDYQVQDSLFIANTQKKIATVEEEFELQKKFGYNARFYKGGKGGNLTSVIGSDSYTAAVRYPDTFGMVAYLYCQALKDELVKQGVQIFENTPVTEIRNDAVVCGAHTVTAGNIVVCADRFLPKLQFLKPDIFAAQTFLAISKPLSDAAVKKMFPESNMMVWDTDLIYQYYRIAGGNRLLMGAASVFYTYLNKEVHNATRVLRKMKKYLAKKYPEVAGEVEFEYMWPGLIGVSKDFAPLAGRDHHMSNVFFVGGAAGLPWAAGLGRYVAEKIVSDRSDYDHFFSPYRKFPIGNAAQFIISKPVSFALSHGFSKYFK